MFDLTIAPVPSPRARRAAEVLLSSTQSERTAWVDTCAVIASFTAPTGREGCKVRANALLDWWAICGCAACGSTEEVQAAHVPSHARKGARTASSLASRGSVSLLITELGRCVPLCVACHTAADRLIAGR